MLMHASVTAAEINYNVRSLLLCHTKNVKKRKFPPAYPSTANLHWVRPFLVFCIVSFPAAYISFGRIISSYLKYYSEILLLLSHQDFILDNDSILFRNAYTCNKMPHY